MNEIVSDLLKHVYNSFEINLFNAIQSIVLITFLLYKSFIIDSTICQTIKKSTIERLLWLQFDL